MKAKEEEKYVCTLCLEEIPSLKKFVEEYEGEKKQCTYHTDCHNKGIPFSKLVERMLVSIKERFEPCEEKNDWSIENILIYSTNHKLIPHGWLGKDIVDAIPEKQWKWKKKEDISQDSEECKSLWDFFSIFIKHHRRFFFQDVKLCKNKYPQIANLITKSVNNLNLVTTIQKETAFYRARIDARDHYNKAEDLCPPPQEKAKANRMSPAGIPMFYCAEDEVTALCETIGFDNLLHKATIATFENTKELTIIDFTSKELPPKDFFSEDDGKKTGILFLNEIIKAISEPIEKNGEEHILYVPSQVLVEYLRHDFKDKNEAIDGIAYRSSRNGKTCYVFFHNCSAFIGEKPLFSILGHLKNIEISPAPFNKKLGDICDELCQKYDLSLPIYQ